MWFFLMYPTECDKQHDQCTSYPRTQAQRPRRRCSGNMCRDSSRHNSSNSHNSVPIQHCFLFRQLEIPTSGKRCGNARVSQTLHKSWGPRRDSGPFLNLIGLGEISYENIICHKTLKCSIWLYKYVYDMKFLLCMKKFMFRVSDDCARSYETIWWTYLFYNHVHVYCVIRYSPWWNTSCLHLPCLSLISLYFIIEML